MVTAETVRCRVGQPITLHARSGYLSSSVTTDSGRGSADCPWRLSVASGQRINLTLFNFARVSVPADWSNTPGPTPPADVARPRPKICYQLANLRERRYTRVLTECEGSPRTSHAFLSSSNVMEVDVIVAKVLKVHFLLHFQGNQRRVRRKVYNSIVDQAGRDLAASQCVWPSSRMPADGAQNPHANFCRSPSMKLCHCRQGVL